METKKNFSKINQEQSKNKNKKNKEKEDKNEKKIEKEQKEQKMENNDIKADNNKSEESKKFIKKPSPWIFLQSNELQGFHITFILMIIIPISVFFIIRNILYKFNFTRNQQDVYGVIGVLISIWMILISYIIYYFRNDFKAFFCPKKGKEKDKTE